MKVKLLPVLTLSVFTLGLLSLAAYPSRVYSAFNNVVINEAQIFGTSAQDEFIELFNPTGAQIDITGWRLTRHTSTGGTESNIVSSLSGVIPAGGFFLVTNPPEYSGSVTPDQEYSAASNDIAANNTITLYSDAGVTIVDRVGFGSAALFEGAAVPTNPAAGGSVQRIGQDTENNANDFEILEASTPMNSNSSPSPTPTSTPTPTASPTPSPSSTPTPSPTPTATSTSTPTSSPTVEPTSTPTPSPIATPSGTPRPGMFRFTLECSVKYKTFGGRFFTVIVPRLECKLVPSS